MSLNNTNSNAKYLSTAKMASILDINAKWLREHRGSIFIEGVHYHFPNGFNDCRWNVKHMCLWIETPSETNTVADEILKTLAA